MNYQIIFKVYSHDMQSFIRRVDHKLTFAQGIRDLEFKSYEEAVETVDEFFEENYYSNDELEIKKIFIKKH